MAPAIYGRCYEWQRRLVSEQSAEKGLQLGGRLDRSSLLLPREMRKEVCRLMF